MQILFIDESGTPPKSNGQPEERYFVIGGVVIHDTAWHRVSKKLLGLKARYKLRGEIKWRYFAPGNSDDRNPMRDLDHCVRNEIRREIFDIIANERGITCLACVSDAKSAYSYTGIITQNDLYHATYKPVTERFQYFLQDFGKQTGRNELGIVVSDHRGTKDDYRLRQHHNKLLHSSSEFTSRYPNFVESLFLQPSNLSIGIQLADMVAGAVWRKYQKDDTRWFDLIEPAFRKSPAGQSTASDS